MDQGGADSDPPIGRRPYPIPPLPESFCSDVFACGRPLDPCGQHRAACSQAEMLGRRRFALESIMARICGEAGGRVRTNVMVRDIDVPAPNTHGRRLEVVVDGLPVRGGAQVAIDTTLQLGKRRRPLIRNTSVHGGARIGGHGGRWSEETRGFLSSLAISRARSEHPLMRKRAEQAWRMRRGGMLVCAVASAVASSLLDLQHSHDGRENPISSLRMRWTATTVVRGWLLDEAARRGCLVMRRCLLHSLLLFLLPASVKKK